MTSEADPAAETPAHRTPPVSGRELPAGLRFDGFLADEHGHHRIEASVPDDVYGTRPAGLIVWESASGAIQYVHTTADLRRRGIAGALWREAGYFARLFGLAIPCHSAHQTRKGAAWAQAVGEQSPLPTPDIAYLY
ncbi:hypothetical protein ACWEQL_00585 [Kitasatospora sp. NPDC004240]